MVDGTQADPVRQSPAHTADGFQHQRDMQRLREDLADRFRKANAIRQSGEMALRLGMLCSFTNDELAVLERVGYLCQLDTGLLERARAATSDADGSSGWLEAFLLRGDMIEATKA